MSDEKKVNKETKKSERSEKKSPESNKKSADTASAEGSRAAKDSSPKESKDESSDKSKASNKSASQTSISHFSSVATKEYRSGWEAIFGSTKDNKGKSKKGSNNLNFPVNLEILDQDISADLRSLLNKAFQRQAKKEGFRLSEYKKLGIIKYNLNCKITEK